MFLYSTGQKVYRAVFKNKPADKNELFQPGRMVSKTKRKSYLHHVSGFYHTALWRVLDYITIATASCGSMRLEKLR